MAQSGMSSLQCLHRNGCMHHLIVEEPRRRQSMPCTAAKASRLFSTKSQGLAGGRHRQSMARCPCCPDTLVYRASPALIPLAPAALRPFFLMIKLEPMNIAELQASASPLAWSADRTAASPKLSMGSTGSSRLSRDPQAHALPSRHCLRPRLIDVLSNGSDQRSL